MTNRYHLPVVVTTDDETTKQEATQYVESVLANLEESDFIFRTYIESNGLDDADATRMLEMFDRIDEESLDAAVAALDEVTDDKNA